MCCRMKRIVSRWILDIDALHSAAPTSYGTAIVVPFVHRIRAYGDDDTLIKNRLTVGL